MVRARLKTELHVAERDGAGLVSGWRPEECRETARRFRHVTNIGADALCSDLAEQRAHRETERVVGIVPARGMRLYELNGKADPVLGVDEGFEPVIRVEDAIFENRNAGGSDARDVRLDIVALERKVLEAFAAVLEEAVHAGFGVPVMNDVQPALVSEKHP